MDSVAVRLRWHGVDSIGVADVLTMTVHSDADLAMTRGISFTSFTPRSLTI